MARCPTTCGRRSRLIRPGTRIVSICTGAFVLAAAGLLDGRPATTHWGYAEDFRRLYPQVELYEDMLFVDDGDVLTSAGLAAGDRPVPAPHPAATHGLAAANQVAKYCVVAPWRTGGQAQFIEHPVPASDEQSTSPVREWALANLHESLDVETPGRAGPDERANVQPPLSRRDRFEPGRLADRAAGEPGSRPARDHRPARSTTSRFARVWAPARACGSSCALISGFRRVPIDEPSGADDCGGTSPPCNNRPLACWPWLIGRGNGSPERCSSWWPSSVAATCLFG